MTITTNGLELIENTSLDVFDTFTYIAFGTDAIAPVSTDTTLSSEVGRILVDSAVQGTNDYTFTARIPKSQFNTSLSKCAMFDAASSGNLGMANVFDTSFTKTVNDEIIIVYKATSSVVNN